MDDSRKEPGLFSISIFTMVETLERKIFDVVSSEVFALFLETAGANREQRKQYKRVKGTLQQE
jgi:hypothetical protein